MDLKENKIVREWIRVSGRVQGVGFRYRAQYFAKNYGVSGFVRNEFDGDVVMELQGTERQIADVLMGLQNSPYIRMESIDAKRIPVKENERGFRVRYA